MAEIERGDRQTGHAVTVQRHQELKATSHQADKLSRDELSRARCVTPRRDGFLSRRRSGLSETVGRCSEIALILSEIALDLEHFGDDLVDVVAVHLLPECLEKRAELLARLQLPLRLGHDGVHHSGGCR